MSEQGAVQHRPRELVRGAQYKSTHLSGAPYTATLGREARMADMAVRVVRTPRPQNKGTASIGVLGYNDVPEEAAHRLVGFTTQAVVG